MYYSYQGGGVLYESIVIVGDRGQITIPKIIREKKGLRPRDKAIVKIEDEKIIVEKHYGKEEKEKLIKEYFKKYSEFEKQISKE